MKPFTAVHARHGGSLFRCCAALLLVLPLAAQAKTGDRNQPMNTSQVKVDGFNAPNTITTLTGNVVVTQGTMKAAGDVAQVYLDADTQVSRIVMKGRPAHIQQLDDNDHLMTGDAPTLDYDNIKGIAVLQPNAVVTQQGMGEAHADVLLERLRTRYGVQVDPVPYRVPLRETFAGAAAARGRHVKQSGGHGQYAICDIEVEPLPGGGGFEFVDRVVGGAVPRQFIPSVEKGVRAQLEKGVRAGYPVVDVRVTLVDGKAHSVDSSDAAFQTAGALALREAAAKAEISLLEPVAEVRVLMPDDYVGAVMSDLSSRRGRVLGTEPVGDGLRGGGSGGRTLVRAEVPEVEIVRYAVDLRSLTHGTGRFSRAYARHEPMPPAVAARLTAEDAQEK
jgi:elongation factor G